MGASFFNLCARSTMEQQVRELLVEWLDKKGFKLQGGVPIFECDKENERCLFLISNSQWTAIFYSHFQDFSRLRYELGKLNSAILEVWVYDSDAWGYRIFESRRVTDSFYYPRSSRIGDEEPGQPEHGDVSFLCETFELDRSVRGRLLSIMRSRAVFKEHLLERFCEAIGVPVAGVDYRDLTEQWLGRVVPSQVGTLRIERLFFSREGHERSVPRVQLHAFRVQKETPREPQIQLPPEVLAQVDARMRHYHMIAMFLRPVGWILRAVFFMSFLLGRLRGRKMTPNAMFSNPELAALFAGQPGDLDVRGNQMINN